MGSMEQRTPWGAKWLASPLGGVLPLALAATGLVLGGLLHVAGQGAAGNLVWIVVAGCGIALSLYSTLESLASGRIGVDVIALLALVGAVVRSSA